MPMEENKPPMPKTVNLKVPANVQTVVPEPEVVVVKPFEEAEQHIRDALDLLSARTEPNAVLCVGKLKGALEKLQA